MNESLPDDGVESTPPASRGGTITDFLSYRASLKRYFGRTVGADEAEDYVQEAFARVLSAAREERVQNPAGFLFRIASNLLAERFRRKSALRRSGTHVALEDAGELASPDCNSPERIVAARENLRRAEEAMAAMPAVRRQVFVMIRLHGASYRDTAAQFGITESAVWYHLDQAVVALCKAGVEL
jgi:RNA polymerase sigma factor (sigma-70 family)